MRRNLAALSCLLLVVSTAWAEPHESVPDTQLRAAVAKALPVIERSAREFTRQRDCFSCHHQTLPVLALTAAREKAIAINSAELDFQLHWSRAFIEKNKEKFREGKGTGGQVDTAGHLLWTLLSQRLPSDDLSSSVAQYLLLRHADKDHWPTSGRRPPTEASDFTASFLAIQALRTYATADQRDRSADRLAAARGWLIETPATDTEDHVFRLRALFAAEAPVAKQQEAAQRLIARQREDGGWSQLDNMESDAYATGSALAALVQCGQAATTDRAYQRGLRFLLDRQLEDGTWHVATRSKPIQTYFESGFPHGKDQFISSSATCWSVVALAAALPDPSQPEYDLVVYGGSSGGVAAAVQARRMGKTVVLIEPGKHLGGLTSGGLGATDIGNKKAIGGISREFYQRVKQYYDEPVVWKQETKEQYRSSRQASGEDTMWTFEPHVAEQIMADMLREAGATVVLNERLDLKNGVIKQDARLTRLRMESGRQFAGRRFIDATYEGDLMAIAGVSYTVGREANARYQETLNGVQTRNAIHHQFVSGVDPYVSKGDASSGLLPGLHAGPPGEEGAEDRRVQAYCFRMCVTDAPENRIPFEKPAGYDEQRYELLLRNFEAGETRAPWAPTMMPNRKTDTNNNRGFSTDNIGMNYDWPEGDYATRERIFQEHLQYQRGLMWTLANHPRVPEPIRKEVSRWGNCNDEFVEHGGWSHQIYVREARRMVAEVVMTQHHCQGREVVKDPVGLAAYTMDSHNVQRYVDAAGHVRNEGDVQVGGFPPYGISYRSIVPAESECVNLLVPVCMSASHIAYGSIRMEPVFMVLGQSAATAAIQSLDGDLPVQRVDYDQLRERLVADQQVLAWTGPPRSVSSLDPATLTGIVLDDEAMERTGEWVASQSVGGFVGRAYWHDNNEQQGKKSVTFRGRVKVSGTYDIRLAFTANANRATNVPVTVEHAEGEVTVRVNQRQAPAIDKAFVSLGEYRLDAGKDCIVTISNENANGYVVADAIQLVPQK